MGIEICSVGGYNEVGKNCTAIKIDDEVIIFDIGIYLEDYIKHTQDEDIVAIDPDQLISVGAIPDVTKIEKWQNKVKAIIPSHAHLDHVGGIAYLAGRYDAPLIGTPFTLAVIKAILKDEKINIPNRMITLNAGSHYRISNNLTVEFVNVTHSTPQTVMVVIHTKYGAVIYGNDFKFDQRPTLGKKPDFKRLKELGNKGVYALIVESTYADLPIRMPSEAIAREMLREVMFHTDTKHKAMIITTFSSHIARLKSIIEFGKKLNRKVVLLGRSLSKYVGAAESVGIVQFTRTVELIRYRSKIERFLRKVSKEGKHKYLLIVTGHQGEPKSTLARMVDGPLNFPFSADDIVIFSAKTIPTPTNIENRKVIEQKLRDRRVRYFTDIHVSGHAAREDLRECLQLIRPKNLIPSHGFRQMRESLKSLALEVGMKDDHIHMMQNGKTISLR